MQIRQLEILIEDLQSFKNSVQDFDAELAAMLIKLLNTPKPIYIPSMPADVYRKQMEAYRKALAENCNKYIDAVNPLNKLTIEERKIVLDGLKRVLALQLNGSEEQKALLQAIKYIETKNWEGIDYKFNIRVDLRSERDVVRLEKALESNLPIDILSLIPGLGVVTAFFDILYIFSNKNPNSKKIEDLGITTAETTIGNISGGIGLIMGIISIADGIEELQENKKIINNTSDKVLKQVNVFVKSDSISKQYFFTVSENTKLEGLQQKSYDLPQGALISLNREPELIVREIQKYAKGCEKNAT